MPTLRSDYGSPGKTAEELADMLVSGPGGGGAFHSATAELRLREHRFLERQTEASERAAKASEDAASEMKRYTRYTFYVVLASWLSVLVAFFSRR